MVIPKSKIKAYEGAQLILDISTSEIITYGEIQEIHESKIIPLLEERLDVSKQTIEDKFTITKEPITQTKTISVSVTHEEISVETRKPEGGQIKTSQKPITSREVIQIPIKREEVKMTKIPYVKEEVVIKKKPITTVTEITEDVTMERVNLSDY